MMQPHNIGICRMRYLFVMLFGEFDDLFARCAADGDRQLHLYDLIMG